MRLLTKIFFLIFLALSAHAQTPTQTLLLSSGGVNLSSCPTQALTYFASLATQPTPARKLLYCNLINALLANGVWATTDSLQIYAAADQATANTPLIGPAPTNHGAAFVANKGYQGNATSWYVDTGFNPTGAANYSLNSASISAYDITSRSSACLSNACALVGNWPGGTAIAYLYPIYSTGNTYALINTNTNTTLSTVANVQGMWTITRSSSTTQVLYQGSTQLASTAATSSLVPNATFFALATNQSGTATNFNNDTIGMFMAGGPLTPTQVTTTYSAFHTFMQAVAGIP